MKKLVKLSVLMPVYNVEKYLNESIQSIVNQTFRDFELIIVDDSSTDNSRQIISEWISKDSRIMVLDNKYQKGLSGALNTGLEACTGEFIARADGDDINKKYRFAEQIAFLTTHPSISIVGAGYQLFGLKYKKNIFHPAQSLKLAWRFISNTYFCHPTIMFKRSILDTIRAYPPHASEDFAFLSKIVQKYKGTNIKKVLLEYRQHESNYSTVKREEIEKSIKEIYEYNFRFYTGSLKDSDIFYDFHAKKTLVLKDTFVIFKISFQITQKLVHQYDSKNIFLKYIFMLTIINIEILVSLMLSSLKKMHHKIKKG